MFGELQKFPEHKCLPIKYNLAKKICANLLRQPHLSNTKFLTFYFLMVNIASTANLAFSRPVAI